MITELCISKIELSDSGNLTFHFSTTNGYDINYEKTVTKYCRIDFKDVSKVEEEIEEKYGFKVFIYMFMTVNSTNYLHEIYLIWNYLELDNRRKLKSLIESYNRELKNYIENDLDKSKIIKLDSKYCPTCGQKLPKEEPKKCIPYKFSDSKVVYFTKFNNYHWINYQPTHNGSIQIWNKTNLKYEIIKDASDESIPYEFRIYIALLLSYFNRLKSIRYNMYSIHILDIFNNPTFSYINKGTRGYQYWVKDEFNPVEKELINSIKKVNKMISNKEKLPQELENILLCDNFLELVYNNEFDGVDLMSDCKEDKKMRLYYE